MCGYAQDCPVYSAVHSAEENREFSPLYAGIARNLELYYQGLGGIVKLGSWRSTAELLPPWLLIMRGLQFLVKDR
jgi:hypothetical protein